MSRLGSGAQSRARLMRKARFAMARGLAGTRAERFMARTAGTPAAPALGLGAIAQWPLWPTLDEGDRHRTFALAALLSGRDALSQVISGSELREYAQPFGEAMFERALALPGGGTRTLAAPLDLAAEGERLARCGLPPALAHSLGESLAGEPEAARHVAEAEGLLHA